MGTHGIRHRAATDIANAGIPVKVGMALTAHKTVAMFMRYIHLEDDPVCEAADKVASRRRETIGNAGAVHALPEAMEDQTGKTRTSLGNYRPFRHRKEEARAVPPDSRRAHSIREEEAP